MSITIRFSIKPRGHDGSWNREQAEALAAKVAAEKGFAVKKELRWTLFYLCPSGFLSMSWKFGRLVGDCRTDAVGAGFHAAAIEFLEAVAKMGDLKLWVFDLTGYYAKRDFLELRSTYFYRPFSEIMSRIAGEETPGSPYLNWTAPNYLPEPLEGRRIADVRPFTEQEIKGIAGSGMSMAFARDFYAWNGQEKDVYYYRNGGLALLNQSCYFKPSSRGGDDKKVNEAAIEYLEKALSMDPEIPFPKKEYLEVCALDGREPVDVSRVWAMPEDLGIGCRKRNIYRTMYNTMFVIPGSFLLQMEPVRGMDRFYDGKEYGNHDFYIYGINTESKGPAQFKENWFEQQPVAEEETFEENGLRGRVVLFEPKEENGETVYTVCGQVLNGFQRNNVMICFRDPSEKDWAFGLIKKIKNAE